MQESHVCGRRVAVSVAEVHICKRRQTSNHVVVTHTGRHEGRRTRRGAEQLLPSPPIGLYLDRRWGRLPASRVRRAAAALRLQKST